MIRFIFDIFTFDLGHLGIIKPIDMYGLQGISGMFDVSI